MKTTEIRKRPQSKRKACCICGEHKRISESHHLIPLMYVCDYVNIGLENSVEFKFKIPEIWLCPNHHSYLHYFQKKQEQYMLGNYFFYETTLGELKAYSQILKMIISWLNSAADEAIQVWGNEIINESGFRAVYSLICQDLVQWKNNYEYLSRILDKRKVESKWTN